MCASRPHRCTPGGPAIAWGGQSVAAARRAARFGLGFLAQTDGDELAAAYRDECAAQGREAGHMHPAEPRHPATMFVADDVDRAWAELGPYLLHDATTYAAWNRQRATPPACRSRRRSTSSGPRTARTGSISVDDADRAHAHGTGTCRLHPLCGGLPPELAWPYLRRVADDVLPNV